MITIVDYGAGNIFSIQNMLKKLGTEAIVGSDPAAIENADKLILPGVGAFDTCAGKLMQSGLQESLQQSVIEKKTPVLGICVGMQLMTVGSEEGVLPGLGWIKGQTVKLKQQDLPALYKIPHMGWSEIELNKSSNLFDGLYDEPRFYFVHSYYVQPVNTEDILAYTTYGKRITVSVERGNILGVQFHPEKSHRYGMRLLENFIKKY